MSATRLPADTEHAATASTEAPELPPRERLLMPSGPAFPEFVYRFLDKLFHLVDASANLAGYREGWSGGRRNDVSCHGSASM